MGERESQLDNLDPRLKWLYSERAGIQADHDAHVKQRDVLDVFNLVVIGASGASLASVVVALIANRPEISAGGFCLSPAFGLGFAALYEGGYELLYRGTTALTDWQIHKIERKLGRSEGSNDI